MGTLAFVGCFQVQHLNAGVTLSSVTLPFEPVRLIGLIGWVYICFYFVQRAQFSPLVPKKYKSIAKIASLFTGPLLLFVLLIVDARKRSLESNQGIFAVIKEQLRHISASLSSKEESAIQLVDSSGRSITDIYGHGKGKHKDSHVLDLTEQIIADALEEQASDILIDPTEESMYTVRFRVDGVLREVDRIEASSCQAVINSIKAVSNMDIAERRRPQDGAFLAKTPEGTVSFRVASAGAVNGEKLSVRVLSQSAGMFMLTNIGLTGKQRSVIQDAVAKPSGMVLICGPTGSGKTTTMYAMLEEIDLFTRNVITVEDPIEYVLPNASQIEVNPKAGITFAKSLRSILRQDPDVICVGEIRDEETAAIALRASQTGHLVLATIHTSSNASALVRLLDLGVSSLMLSSGLNVLISQRLIRRLCKDCKKPAKLSQSQIHDLSRKGVDHRNIFQPTGCEQCHETGYRRRTAIFDILALDHELKASIASGDLSITQLRKEGDKKGRSNMRKQGLRMVVSGITSLEELKRVVG